MRIRKLLPLVLASATLLAFGLVGCEPTTAPDMPDMDALSKPKPVDPGPPAPPEHGNNNGNGKGNGQGRAQERPIKGAFKGFEPVWVVSHFFERTCNGIVAGAEVKSRGNVSHLGLTEVTASAAWDWADRPAGGYLPEGPTTGPSATIVSGAYEFCSQPVTATGRVTLAAANGDVLYGFVAGGEVYELGFAVAGDGQEQFMEVEVEGGTGRFANATGHFVIHSIFNLVDMKIVQSGIMPGGGISY